jgi:hypothetical protein
MLVARAELQYLLSVASHAYSPEQTEMSHAFDNKGSHFDANRDLQEWWTDPVRERFEAKAKCIRHLYDQFEIAVPILCLHLDNELSRAGFNSLGYEPAHLCVSCCRASQSGAQKLWTRTLQTLADSK